MAKTLIRLFIVEVTISLRGGIGSLLNNHVMFTGRSPDMTEHWTETDWPASYDSSPNVNGLNFGGTWGKKRQLNQNIEWSLLYQQKGWSTLTGIFQYDNLEPLIQFTAGKKKKIPTELFNSLWWKRFQIHFIRENWMAAVWGMEKNSTKLDQTKEDFQLPRSSKWYPLQR